MNKKDLLFLEEFEKKLNSLTQNELYNLLVDCGMQGLQKSDSRKKGKIILTNEIDIPLSAEIIIPTITESTVYKTIETNSWNHINNKELTNKDNKNYNFAA